MVGTTSFNVAWNPSVNYPFSFHGFEWRYGITATLMPANLTCGTPSPPPPSPSPPPPPSPPVVHATLLPTLDSQFLHTSVSMVGGTVELYTAVIRIASLNGTSSVPTVLPITVAATSSSTSSTAASTATAAAASTHRRRLHSSTPAAASPTTATSTSTATTAATATAAAASADDFLYVKAVFPTTGWVSMGWNPTDGGMTACDCVMATVDATTGAVTMNDYYSIGPVTPDLDTAIGGTNDILWASGSVSVAASTTTLYFTRKLVTGDTKGDTDILNAAAPVTFAWGASAAYAYHGTKMRGMQRLNLQAWVYVPGTNSSGTSASSVSDGGYFKGRLTEEEHSALAISHGAMMFTAWVGLAGTGIVFPRYIRYWKHWEVWHIRCEVGCILLALIGEILGLITSQGEWNGAHHWVSLPIIFGGFFQGYLGFVCRKGSVQFDMARLHRVVGYFMLTLTFIQMWLGLYLYSVSHSMDARILPSAFAIAMSLIVAIQLSTDQLTTQDLSEVLKRQITKMQKEAEKAEKAAAKGAKGGKGGGAATKKAAASPGVKPEASVVGGSEAGWLDELADEERQKKTGSLITPSVIGGSGSDDGSLALSGEGGEEFEEYEEEVEEEEEVDEEGEEGDEDEDGASNLPPMTMHEYKEKVENNSLFTIVEVGVRTRGQEA